MTRRDIVNAVVLFLLNVALTYPLFLPGDTPYRDSIEGGYQAMARFINAHPNPWGWNPLQYGGLPTQFMYLPALPYAVWLLPGDAAYSYKLLTAAFACLGPVTLYIAFVYFTGSRFWAIVAALGYTFFSPLYGLVAQADKDRGITYLPWRLHVFAKYGEGPHAVGLTLLPLAWIAVVKAATSRRFVHIFILAITMAAITLTNWVAALGLAISCLVLFAAAAGWPEFQHWRVLAAGAIAYGMAAFWLTPTFIHTIAFNWPEDAFAYKLEAAQHRLIIVYLVLFAALWIASRWLKWPFWERFLTLSAFAFGFPVIMHYAWGVDMIPESRRYAVEFELALIAALVAFLRFALSTTNYVRYACAATAALAFLIAGRGQLGAFATQSKAALRPIPIEGTPEYQAARWIADQKPKGRVLASGGLRFRLNSWFDLPQVGGAFESGLRNRTPVHVAYRIRTSEDAVASVRDMQAMGVEYAVVHGVGSTEHYRDYKHPAKFEGVLEKVYDRDNNAIYRVPLADTMPTWLATDHLRIESVSESKSITVSYDEGWRAFRDGRAIPVSKDERGFIRLPAGAGSVDLVYSGTPEQKAFAALSALTWIAALVTVWRSR